MDFIRCTKCGKIFPVDQANSALCPSCREEAGEGRSDREQLRDLKNKIRDAHAKGVFFTIDELSELTDIPQDKIWSFIKKGEIDTAPFSDPAVQQYLVRRKLELMQATRKRDGDSGAETEKNQNPEKYLGFHHKRDESDR